jgi:hypothetical protein
MHCDSKAFSFLRCLDEGDEVGEPFSSSSLHDRSSMPPCCRLLNAALREKGKSAAEQYAHERSHSNQDRVAHTSSKAAALGAVSWAEGPGVVDVALLRDGLM